MPATIPKDLMPALQGVIPSNVTTCSLSGGTRMAPPGRFTEVACLQKTVGNSGGLRPVSRAWSA